MTLFRGKFRIESTRLKGYDYASPGAYYVTICTKNRDQSFGMIDGGKIHLSELGKIAENFWREIPYHFVYAEIDEFVVMPNHGHGIIWILHRPVNSVIPVETQHAASPKTKPQNAVLPHERIPPGSLGAIVRSYKSAVKKWTTAKGIPFAWQSRYHDRIIRDDKSLRKIGLYISYNPVNWPNDRLNKQPR